MMQESDLYLQWFKWASSKKAVTTEGHHLQILEGGQLNRQRGPDIQHASFKLDGCVYRGAVEFHLNTRDWYQHHHHLDKAFADVLLHLVATKEKGDDCVHHQGSGIRIPTLVIPVSHATNVGQAQTFCIKFDRLEPQEKEKLLQSMALLRLEMKVRQFIKQLSLQDADQIYYQASMRTWGYPHNALPFSLLSAKFPWTQIRRWEIQWSLDEESLYAILAGLAGFLPVDDSDDSFLRSLQDRFRFLKQRMNITPIDPEHWIWAGCRPANHPHLRLAGMIQLLCSHDYPFWKKAGQLLASRQGLKQIFKPIANLFNIPIHPYWKTHYALGQICAQPGRLKYFGRQRISEWLVNVLLPIQIAEAALRDSHGFEEYLYALYLALPQNHSYGQLSKWDCHGKMPTKAYINQGLIHFQKYFCAQGMCATCPVNNIT